ncbi:hypothetical protein DSO57_1002567 [Entomophthora muscae]|uniref:Uncharacterized protein n=1 Tax=Entomophthora muscae TaxID=34485 RepID=A0ACC2U7J5_9FUNG|nr:hypothetical protein DSO57_1002567 [Entomophthora muscae]
MRPPLKSSFLEGKSILITGATGFLGKVLLELLLREHHPFINKIYCLVRPGGVGGIYARLLTLFEDKLFHILRSQLGPDAFYALIWSKVTAIQGDLTSSGLGLSHNDKYNICSKVNYVINAATTADFNERIDRSVQVNTLGTLRVMDLCDECTSLIGMIHISSAFVNANQLSPSSILNILEKVYPLKEMSAQL